ncbi:MAG TPA: tRNA (adenine-N1)-methyltransferase [Acidimicrobiia bacterium]|nr:tRNA (adenine-N1)-methyltransferase [Acidimicrobiia bacterium]
MTDRFADGELCLLIDAKGRKHLVDLRPGRTFQFHAGVIRHEDIIGAEAGVVVRTGTGAKVAALRPRLADYVLTMRRGAQVVYPKDLGPMIHWGDARPGHLVVEAGTGSGALTMAILAAVGPTGRVVSVDRREDHQEHARGVMERLLGELPANLELVVGDVAEEVAHHRPDRVFLDLPEPWHVVPPAAEALTPGGVLCAYLPTIPQVMHLRDALRRARRYAAVETFETLHREWQFEGRSVRPRSQMVGHTGFITVARSVVGETLDEDEQEATQDDGDA